MKFDEFFKCFYIDRSTSGLVGYKSKEKIPQFFMEAALGEGSNLLPTALNTYAKWFDNLRQPTTQLWNGIINAAREDIFRDALIKTLNLSQIIRVASRFYIIPPKGESVDKEAFAHAITKQFYEIAKGNGNGANIAAKAYKPMLITFSVYSQKALLKYSKIKTPFTNDEERPLEEVYVCNSIISRSMNSGRVSRGAVHTIDEISLDKICEYSPKTILIGNGGMGKSIMLNYLFVNSIKHHEESGVLPILAELREFSYGPKTIFDYLVEAVTHFDNSFNERVLIKLLEQGKCQILLDGIDEIDPSDSNTFQDQLSELVDKYPNNQYVLASRDCEMVRAAVGFSKMYLQPFDDSKKMELIDKLLYLPEDKETKDDIKLFLQDQFIKDHCVFATNPMLLTFVVAKHPILKTFNGKQSLFYKAIYETIIYGHDKSKPNYSRIFHSVKDGDEFTTAFREFCALSYKDNVSQFDAVEFEKYFKKLKSKDGLENPHKFTKNNFLRDACATSCMLFEHQSKLFYIDEGFQALLFAEQMTFDEIKNVIEVEEFLSKKKNEEFNSFKGFDYFMEMDLDKVESCFFFPFLSKIFKNKNDESSYFTFLEMCHSDMRYSTTDSIMKSKWDGKIEPIKSWTLNESANVIYTMILNKLEQSCTFILDCYPVDLDYPEFRKATIYGEIIDKKLPMKVNATSIPGDTTYFEKTASPDKYLFEKDSPAIIGREYELDISKAIKDKEKYSQLLSILINKTCELRNCYNRLKEYYDFLLKKFR